MHDRQPRMIETDLNNRTTVPEVANIYECVEANPVSCKVSKSSKQSCGKLIKSYI